MSTEKRTISLPGKLYEKAMGRVEELDYAGLSDYVQELIRRDVMRETHGEPLPAAGAAEPNVDYRTKPKTTKPAQKKARFEE